MNDLPNRYLTKRQVAVILSVNEDTVDNYCKARKLLFHRIKAGKRFDPADVKAFMGEKFGADGAHQ